MPGTKILNRDLDLKGTSRLLKDGQEIIDAAGNITAPLEFSSTDFVKDTNGNEVLGFGETASAVNYVKVTNAATSGVPLISAAGDDTNIGVWVAGKGTGAVALGQASSTGVVLFADQPLLDSSLNELVKFSKAASAVNEVTITNAATTDSPAVSATGGDSHIDLQLSAKGNGIVSVGDEGTGTTSSFAVTLNTQKGVITTEALTTAAGSTQNITLTNSKMTADTVMLVTLGAGTNTAGTPLLFITPGSGSATITILNAHASAALNGTLKIHFVLV